MTNLRILLIYGASNSYGKGLIVFRGNLNNLAELVLTIEFDYKIPSSNTCSVPSYTPLSSSFKCKIRKTP